MKYLYIVIRQHHGQLQLVGAFDILETAHTYKEAQELQFPELRFGVLSCPYSTVVNQKYTKKL